jgi:D-alanine-D-alanine ligase
MRIAVVHNIEQHGVINQFGRPNKEMYYRNEIDLFLANLKSSDFQVEEFDGDKFLFQQLQDFLPSIPRETKPGGIVFNLAYGIQGESRYTHVPAMLELAGVPYTGSGPLAHSIALDKEMTKRVLLQAGIPTPRFVVVEKDTDQADLKNHGLRYPLIIKPKNEAGSFGISVVDNDDELLKNVSLTLEEYNQTLVIEEYLDGRELNVGLLGNGSNLEVFDPVEIDFTASGERFQSFSGKKGGSYRHICPADIPESLIVELQEIAKETFALLRCCDYARVDFRLDSDMKPYVLEINSMAAIHEKGSYYHGARRAGYGYQGMLNKMIEVAINRY